MGNFWTDLAGNAVDVAGSVATAPIKLGSGLMYGNWNPIDTGISERIAGHATVMSTPQTTQITNPYFDQANYAKPTQPTQNVDDPYNTGAYYGATGGTGGVGGTAPVDLSQYDQGINTYNTAINRLPGQLDIANGNINNQFNTSQNELNSTKDQAQGSYNTSSTQNSQNLRTNKNTINDQASAGLRGLQRQLGAYGAGGSSDALYNAPTAVADQASQQRAGAGQTFAQNQSGLDTNWSNFQTEDGNSRRKLEDWKTGQLNNAQAQSQTTKQDLLTKLAGLTGARTAAAGGSYTGGAQPFIDQANALNSSIDQLGRMNPTYDGKTPTYTARALDSYTAGTGAQARIDPSAASAGMSPYLAMLLGQNKDKNQGVY